MIVRRVDLVSAPPSGVSRLAASLVAIMVLAPVPLGSNRPAFIAWLGLALGGLLLLTVASPAHRAALSIQGAAGPASLFLGVVAFIAFQAMPNMPEAWQADAWLLAADTLGAPVWGSISIAPEATLLALMRLCSNLAAAWLGWALLRDEASRRVALWAILLATAATSAYGLVNWVAGWNSVLGIPKERFVTDVTGTFINRNHFAIHAAIALAAAAELLASSFGRLEGMARIRQLLLILGLGGLIGVAILFTHSRAGIALACLAPVIVILLRGSVSAMPGVLKLAIGAAVLVAAGAASVAGLGYAVQERQEALDGGLLERLQVWQLSWQAWRENPILGQGYGTFEFAFPALRDASLSLGPSWDRAHNIYLEALIGLGTPAFVALALALGWVILRCLRTALTERRETGLLRVALAGVFVAAAQSTLEFSLSIPGIAIPLSILLGAAAARSMARGPDVPAVFVSADRRLA